MAEGQRPLLFTSAYGCIMRSIRLLINCLPRLLESISLQWDKRGNLKGIATTGIEKEKKKSELFPHRGSLECTFRKTLPLIIILTSCMWAHKKFFTPVSYSNKITTTDFSEKTSLKTKSSEVFPRSQTFLSHQPR